MLPATPHLEGVVQHLADKGDHRSLVTLVETWGELGEPSIPARLALARSLLALRCFDRAWARVRDLVEAPEPNLDALQIAAEMFLLRGWPNQARKILQRGLERVPHHPALLALDKRAQEPLPSVDENTAESEAATVAELIRVAEQYMARGSMVRARSLLERVRRRVSDHPRAVELLWAMDGLFVTSEPLDALCRKWGPALPSQMDNDLEEEPEHTESARVEDLRSSDSEDSFPQLFRNLGASNRLPPESPPEKKPELELLSTPISEFDSNEQTAVTFMAELGAYHEEPPPELTDAGEDTQIARVMSKKGVQQVSGVVHLGTAPVDSRFNLEDYRREMGMTGSGLDSDFGGPEDEDDSVVILTGQDHDDAPETSDTGRLDLDPEYLKAEARAKAKLSSNEESWAAPRPRPEPVEEDDDLQAEGVTERPASPRVAGPSARHVPEPEEAPTPKETPLPTAPPAVLRPGLPPGVPGAGMPVDVTAELTPQVQPIFPRPGQHGSPWGLGPSPLGAWPYWIAALSTVLMMFVMIFGVLSVVFALFGG
jgi:hypothetical protein